MSPVCFIHDMAYSYARPVLEDWYQANEDFCRNMINTIFAQQPRNLNQKENGDLYRAITYYTAVDASPAPFWRTKKTQELI